MRACPSSVAYSQSHATYTLVRSLRFLLPLRKDLAFSFRRLVLVQQIASCDPLVPYSLVKFPFRPDPPQYPSGTRQRQILNAPKGFPQKSSPPRIRAAAVPLPKGRSRRPERHVATVEEPRQEVFPGTAAGSVRTNNGPVIDWHWNMRRGTVCRSL